MLCNDDMPCVSCLNFVAFGLSKYMISWTFKVMKPRDSRPVTDDSMRRKFHKQLVEKPLSPPASVPVKAYDSDHVPKRIALYNIYDLASVSGSPQGIMTCMLVSRVSPPVDLEVWVRQEESCNWVKGNIVRVLEQVSSLPPQEAIVKLRNTKYDSKSAELVMQASLKNVARTLPTPYALGTKGTAFLRRVVVPKSKSTRTGRTINDLRLETGLIIGSVSVAQNHNEYLVCLASGEWRYVAHVDIKLTFAGDMEDFLAERKKGQYPESDEFLKYAVKCLEGRRKSDRKLETKLISEEGGLVVIVKNERWQIARVVKVERDLVKVQFEYSGASEWMFRRSPRFKNVFDHYAEEQPEYWNKDPEEQRSKLLENLGDLNGLSMCQGFTGRLRSLVIPKRKEFVRESHEGDCLATCVPRLEIGKSRTSPLALPMHFGWKRACCLCSIHPHIIYISPCGKEIDSGSLLKYLLATDSNFSVDMFCFDVQISCSSVFVPEGKIRIQSNDLSNGQENIKIRCVNGVDNELKPNFVYSSKCVVGEDVVMLDEKEAIYFLSCCDCVDGDCSSSESCACRRLTEEEAGQMNGKECGYVMRKLTSTVDTGIYECNERCSCRKNICTNRVVQNGMLWPLQVFKSKTKGWAVRTLCDIPRGSFVSTFAGLLHTEAVGEKMAIVNGDEYMAELAFLPRLEKAQKSHKLGYEPSPDVWRNSIKEFFSDDQYSFTIDPKHVGNISRFYSHSCNPNMTLQHVFVGSHDLRFPISAFFTKKQVKAGSELCWDYGYKIGSVQGKNIPCQCGVPSCRKRLL